MLDPVTRAIEALLLLTGEPLEVAVLASATGVEEEQAASCLAMLEQSYVDGGRGMRLERSRVGVRLVTAPEAADAVARFQGLDRTPRLSGAALDALAVVAYRQPVTRSDIESIRGVGSDHVLGVLMNAGLIEEVGRSDSIGKPVLFGTTPSFLEASGLTSLDELPPLEESTY